MKDSKMMSKKILLIVTGGVAIYKSLSLIRLLVKAGCEVKCVMTESAKQMISPLLFATISKNRVYSELFFDQKDRDIEHISLTRYADLVVVAPATANIIGKMANGIADDLASTTLMASNKPIIVAPAMNCMMWKNKAVQRNIEQLERDGVIFAGPAKGEMACNESGEGRMLEPEEIFDTISAFIKNNE